MSCPLDKLSTDAGVSSVQVIKHLDTMIKNNITVIIILLIILVVLGLGLYYFSKSLVSTLSKYYEMKEVNKTSNSESLKDKAADNEEYPEQPDPNNLEEQDLKIVIDPSKFMPKAKRDFVSKLTLENKGYNQAKTDFVTRKLNYDENDDIIDSKILYKDYDNYNYDYSTD